MAAFPAPRTPAEHHAPRCTKHHVHLVSCPDCNAWHRDLLRTQRDEAARRQAQREATP